MEQKQIIEALIAGVLAVISFHISYRQHKEKGFIFSNVWIWATKEWREKMDENIKKALYRVSRNAFFIVGVILLLVMINMLTLIGWILYLIHILAAILLIYVITESVKEKYYQK